MSQEPIYPDEGVRNVVNLGFSTIQVSRFVQVDSAASAPWAVTYADPSSGALGITIERILPSQTGPIQAIGEALVEVGSTPVGAGMTVQSDAFGRAVPHAGGEPLGLALTGAPSGGFVAVNFIDPSTIDNPVPRTFTQAVGGNNTLPTGSTAWQLLEWGAVPTDQGNDFSWDGLCTFTVNPGRSSDFKLEANVTFDQTASGNRGNVRTEFRVDGVAIAGT